MVSLLKTCTSLRLEKRLKLGIWLVVASADVRTDTNNAPKGGHAVLSSRVLLLTDFVRIRHFSVGW